MAIISLEIDFNIIKQVMVQFYTFLSLITPIWRPGSRWEYNIKANLKGVRCEDGMWTHLSVVVDDRF